MPGGFTLADAFAGFCDGVVAGMAFAGWVTAGVVIVVLIGLAAGTLIHRAGRALDQSNLASARAMAHERVGRHEALPYTDERAFENDAAWPERKAS